MPTRAASLAAQDSAGRSVSDPRRVVIGVDKSMLVEVPTDLTNVLVSNPEVIDAVVQTSRQVYLLAKDMGEANAFFMGPDGAEDPAARDLGAARPGVDARFRCIAFCPARASRPR